MLGLACFLLGILLYTLYTYIIYNIQKINNIIPSPHYDEHNTQVSAFSSAHLLFFLANSGSIVNCCVFAFGLVRR